MKTRIQKWGNSLALRIPKSFAAETGLECDAPVDLLLKGGKLIVKPAIKPALTLKHLLSQVTEHNLHREIDTGESMGNEVW